MDHIKVDLHLHTNHSDGDLSPSDLVELCFERGLQTIAVTDHDTTSALQEARECASKFGIRLINGIELGTNYLDDEVHILGYGIDLQDAGFQDKLSIFRKDRLLRGKKIIEKLVSIGLNISWEMVRNIAKGDSVGRPHIAMALVELGYAANIKDAFKKYLNTDSPGFIPREMVRPTEAVEILRDNGALPVLAHPLLSNSKSGRKSIQNLVELIPELCEAGLMGIEVYYGDYDSQQVSRLIELAEKYSLIKCGGSDYHNSENRDDPHPGDVGPPQESVKQIDLAISREF
ncbi:MAG TPA: PHP domain-containing protein [SAR202 cluster bacterium]|jgi:hypothetical protein|nr:PHP domain-containing protein [SAR202 cluster bacterium]HJO59369.1 PHP domain-containing protein [SAR202 cluster bacterium]|tara:strand:+ start:132 stop:995 length:864 start_codon:yes stop_codon:yes gene_type:complete